MFIASARRVEDEHGHHLRLQGQGKLRHIGFSTHDPNYAARLLGTYPAFNTVMVAVPFVFGMGVNVRVPVVPGLV